MRNFTTIILLLFTIKCFSQGAVVVVRNPSWVADDKAKENKEMFDRMREYAKISEQVEHSREQLKYLKEATQKLREINRRVANYRYLEESIVLVNEAYSKVLKTLNTLNDNNCLSAAEYRRINESLMGLVSKTSYSIAALTVVVTENFSQMTDGERLMNINQSLRDLRETLGVINAALWEVEILNYQRLQLRSLRYINAILK